MKVFTVLLFFFPCFSVFCQINLSDGLIGCYSLDGHTEDASAFKNHATQYGATPTANRFGIPNMAFAFDGIDDHILIPSDLLKSANFSYMVWAKVFSNPKTGVAAIVFSIGDEFDSKHQTINVSNVYANDGFVGWNVGGYNVGTPSTTSLQSYRMPTINEWYHLAMVRGDDEIVMYINGQRIASGSTYGLSPYYGASTNAVLGMRCNYTQPFHGAIDDFVVYDRILSDEEIEFAFQNGIPCGEKRIQNYEACKGESIELRAYDGDTFVWYDEHGEVVFEGNPFTPTLFKNSEFTVTTIKDGAELPVQAFIVSVFDHPQISLSYPSEIITLAETKFSVVVKNEESDSFVWQVGEEISSYTSSEIAYVFETPGDYTVKVLVENQWGCISVLEEVVSVKRLLEDIDLFEGLVACYSFEKNADDKSGNGNNGVVHGAVPTEDRFGTKESAYYFRGGGDYISLPPSKLKNPTFTYAVWVKTLSIPKLGVAAIVFSIGDKHDSKHQTINVSNIYSSVGHVGWNAGGYNTGFPGTTSLESRQMPDIDTWYHLAMTRDNSVMKMYINGLLIASGSTHGLLPYYGNSTNAHLGIRCNLTQPFHGVIDDFVIYDRVLNNSEIWELFEKGIPCEQISVNGASRCGEGEVEASASGALNYNWYNENGALIFTGNPLNVNLSSTTTVYVEGITDKRTFPKQTVDLIIHPKLEVECDYPDGLELYNNHTIETKPISGTPPYRFEWTVGGERLENNSSSILINPKADADLTFSILISDDNGCIATCGKTLPVDNFFFVPNVISPNGDSFNESFNLFRRIKSNFYLYEGSEDFQLKIYNRWGEKVFTTNDSTVGWNGFGSLTGLYFYSINVGKIDFRGWVHLVKGE